MSLVKCFTIFYFNWDFRKFNPDWQSGGRVIIFLCKYYIIISDTLVGSFLDVLFLLLSVRLSGLYEKPRKKKDWVTEKKSIEEFVWETSFFLTARPSFYVTFCCFFLPLPKWCNYWMDPIKMHNTAMGGILCDGTTSERLKIWKSLTI